jgi:hypothetical protein
MGVTFKSKELQGGMVVFSVGLRKEWAKVAGYWVSLVAVKVGPLTFWHSVRSWSFKKDGELISDELVGSRQTRPGQALKLMKESIEEKVHRSGYVIHEVMVDSQLPIAEVPAPLAAEINAYCSVLQQVVTDPSVKPAPIMDWVEQKAKEARAKEEEHNTFMTAVKRRKKDAKWG